MHNDSKWIFGVKELGKGKIWSGVVKIVVDGDTIDISFGITGIQRIRLFGVNTPDIGEEGYEEAEEFVNKTWRLIISHKGGFGILYNGWRVSEVPERSEGIWVGASEGCVARYPPVM